MPKGTMHPFALAMETERLINNEALCAAVRHICAAGLGNPTGHNPEAEVRRIVRQEIERAKEDGV